MKKKKKISKCYLLNLSTVWQVLIMYKLQHEIMYFIACMPSQDSDQNKYLCRLIWVFDGHPMDSHGFFWQTVKTRIKNFVDPYTSWTESEQFVLFGLYVAFNNFSVISWRCLDVAGSSMLTFRVLPHWNITPQTLDMISHPVTLYWHWADQFWLLALLSYFWAPSERAASTIFKVFGMTRPGTEPTTSRHKADALSTNPLFLLLSLSKQGTLPIL